MHVSFPMSMTRFGAQPTWHMCDCVKRPSICRVHSRMLAVNILLKTQINCPSWEAMIMLANIMDISNGVNAIIPINQIRIINMQLLLLSPKINQINFFFQLGLRMCHCAQHDSCFEHFCMPLRFQYLTQVQYPPLFTPTIKLSMQG